MRLAGYNEFPKTKRGTISCASTEEHNYLNFAETRSPKPRRLTHISLSPLTFFAFPPRFTRSEGRTARTVSQRQAVRSLGPLGFTCYQASTCGLSTRSSPWDLDCLTQTVGRRVWEAASRLDAVSAYPFST